MLQNTGLFLKKEWNGNKATLSRTTCLQLQSPNRSLEKKESKSKDSANMGEWRRNVEMSNSKQQVCQPPPPLKNNT